MKKHSIAPVNNALSRGLTLVELLVAMVLGLFLAGIVGTVFVSFNTTTQLSRVQESTRFATSFLKRDIRMTGYRECSQSTDIESLLNPPGLLTDSGIFGWEFLGTGINNATAAELDYEIIHSGNPTDISATRSSNTGTASKWKDRVNVNLPEFIHDLHPLKGSDIIMLTNESKLDLTLKKINNINTNQIGTNEKVSDVIGAGAIIKVGDCSKQDKFQLVASAGKTLSAGQGGAGYTPGNLNGAAFKWSELWGGDHSVYVEKTILYYIATGNSGLPSLYRLASNCNLSEKCANSTNSSSSSEVVEGVESMQILYGEDTDSPSDRVANIYRSANAVADFDNVVSVRISLLVRSPGNGRDQIDKANYLLADNISIDPPDERFIRFVTNNTIHLRNMGN